MDTNNITHLITTVSSITTGDSSKSGVDFLPLVRISNWIWTICMPVAFTLGVFGNVMTIVIIRRFQTNRSVLDRYFSCVAVTDLCVSIVGIPQDWIIIVTDFQLIGLHDILCKLIIFILNVAIACSAWILVVMVINRAISVVWPHRVNVVCTARISRGIILSIVIVFSLAYSHFLYGMEVSNGGCQFKEDYLMFMMNVWVKIDIFLYSVLPFVCLTISNTVLVLKLKTSVKEAGDQFSATDRQQSEREKKVNSITLTAIVVSMSYIVLTLPMAIKSLIYFNFTGTDSSQAQNVHEMDLSQFLHGLFWFINYLNYCMNFYLYCLTGRRFRKEFLEIMSGLFPCCRSPKF